MAQFHDTPDLYLKAMRGMLPLYDRLQDEVTAASSQVDASRILDLGAGTGETSRRCLKAHPQATIIAIDASIEMLDVAFATLGERAECRVAGLEDPFPAGPFELVVSALAVHHLRGPGKVHLFRRAWERLTPDGVFVLGDVVVPEQPACQPTPLDPAVDFPERLDDLVGWLKRAGFRPRVHWAEQDLVVIAASK
jgi:tRNA (cmo5U34)-methyltransferase